MATEENLKATADKKKLSGIFGILMLVSMGIMVAGFILSALATPEMNVIECSILVHFVFLLLILGGFSLMIFFHIKRGGLPGFTSV